MSFLLFNDVLLTFGSALTEFDLCWFLLIIVPTLDPKRD